MKKTFVAFVAVAAIAASFATPASAQRGLGAAVAGGIIGGAIVGSVIAANPPRRRPMLITPLPVRPMWKLLLPGLPLRSRALLGWLRMALPPRRGLRLI